LSPPSHHVISPSTFEEKTINTTAAVLFYFLHTSQPLNLSHGVRDLFLRFLINGRKAGEEEKVYFGTWTAAALPFNRPM
jgi:hypothetical protein